MALNPNCLRVWVVLLLWMTMVLMRPASAATAPIELRSGTATTTVGGVTRTQPVTLSYHWDRLHRGQPGFASFDLPFRLDALPGEPWGIFIPRAGNVLEVSMNGAVLQTFGDLRVANGPDYAKEPLYLQVPARMLKSGDNQMQILIRADTGRRAGLSAVTIGPARYVQGELFDVAHGWRTTGTVLLAAFSVIVGAIALALWLSQINIGTPGRSGREALYLWAAVAEFCWALRIADGVMQHPPLPWVAWGTLMTACYAGWVAASMLFCHHVAGWNRRPVLQWMHGAMALLIGGSIVSTWLALARAEPRWLTTWLGLELMGVALYVGYFVFATARRPDMARVLVALAALGSVAVAARDWTVIRVSDAYGETTWIRYTSVFFGLALLTIVLTRFRSVSVQARQGAMRLTDRVAQRETELASTYARLEQSAREQARTHERERILRDMHDGVGSHISAAIRQLQSGQSSSAELLRTLRDSLDQLKLSIDSIHLPAGDVTALLAALRYRLEPRLRASGIALEWDVDELAPVAWLDAQGTRQLQFLLFEAISNVLQHAGATMLRIEAAMHGAVLRLRVVDNGRGFEALEPPRALRERAQAIGARLTVQSRPACTVVQLEFD